MLSSLKYTLPVTAFCEHLNYFCMIVEVYITSVGILNICNLWILLRKILIYSILSAENFIFAAFFAVKVE